MTFLTRIVHDYDDSFRFKIHGLKHFNVDVHEFDDNLNFRFEYICERSKPYIRKYFSLPIRPDGLPVPKEIDFPRYDMKCSGENVIQRGIFHVVSCFPLHFM